jgi:hypothetical protein
VTTGIGFRRVVGGLLGALALSGALVGLGGSAAASRKSDTALANRAVLKLSDFPSGWREQPPSLTFDQQLAQEEAIPDCKNDVARLKLAYQQTPHSDVDRPLFANGTPAGQYVSSAVAVYKNVKAAKAAMANLDDPTHAKCVQAFIEQNVKANIAKAGSNAQVQSVQTGKASVEKFGDDTNDYQTVISATAPPLTLTSMVYSDSMTVRQGRNVAYFTFQNTGSPFADRGNFINTVLGRLAPKASGAPADTAASTTTTLANGALALGASAKTPRGNTITVHSYEQPATGIPTYRTPQDSNNEFAAADVEACATGGQPVAVNSFNFKLQMPDNTRRNTTFAKDPALNFTNLAANDCVRGWVSFEVPVGQRPAYVVYDDGGLTGSSAPLKWNVG